MDRKIAYLNRILFSGDANKSDELAAFFVYDLNPSSPIVFIRCQRIDTFHMSQFHDDYDKKSG